MMKKLILPAALILAAASCSKDHTLTEMTETPIGTGGGTAFSADGNLSVIVPANAVSGETIFTIETLRTVNVTDQASLVYELGPEGVQFNDGVEARFITNVRSGEAVVANVDSTPEILENSMHNPATGVVSAKLEHFSRYCVLTTRTSTQGDPCRDGSCASDCTGLACGTTCDWCATGGSNCQSPIEGAKCDEQGQCADAFSVVCPPPDAGVTDTGTPDTGTSTGTLVTVRHTQYRQRTADVLVVVDQSGSMADERQNLENNILDVLTPLAGYDYVVAVAGMNTATSSSGSPILGFVTSRSSTNALSQIVASLPPGGGTMEKGFVTAANALTEVNTPLRASRDGVWTTLIFISDEDDMSGTEWPTVNGFYQNVLLNQVGFSDFAHRIRANTITGGLTGCNGTGGNAQTAPRYDEITGDTNGVFDSICGTSWHNALTDLGGPGHGWQRDFYVDVTGMIPGTMNVYVNGAQATNWVFNSTTSHVSFGNGSIPPAGAAILITFLVP